MRLSHSTFIRAAVRLVLISSLGLLALSTRSSAQGYDCDRLRQDIAAAGRSDPQANAQAVRELQRQRIQLARTQTYVDQLGCTRGFLIFGGSGPPQCDGLLAQVDRLTSTVSTLQQQVSQGDSGQSGRQAALIEQYRAYCGTDPSAANPNEFFGDSMRPGLDNGDNEDQEQGGVRRYSKVICVRTCDGGFFPLSFAPAQRDSAGLQSLCSALCPNTEAKAYTTPDLDNIGSAVSLEGAAYNDLPNAFKYQKSFDPTCSCKPPNKSWVEALAEAEKLLDAGSAKDVTVTAKMSDEMAKPIAAPTDAKSASPNASRKKKGFDQAQIKAILDAQVAAEGALGAVGAQAPTASTESAGIANDAGKSSPVMKTDEGEIKTEKAPDGKTRRVRIIGPTL